MKTTIIKDSRRILEQLFEDIVAKTSKLEGKIVVSDLAKQIGMDEKYTQLCLDFLESAGYIGWKGANRTNDNPLHWKVVILSPSTIRLIEDNTSL